MSPKLTIMTVKLHNITSKFSIMTGEYSTIILSFPTKKFNVVGNFGPLVENLATIIGNFHGIVGS